MGVATAIEAGVAAVEGGVAAVEVGGAAVAVGVASVAAGVGAVAAEVEAREGAGRVLVGDVATLTILAESGERLRGARTERQRPPCTLSRRVTSLSWSPSCPPVSSSTLLPCTLPRWVT